MDGQDEVRELLVRAARRAYRRGIQTGDGGNVSARVGPNGRSMIVTRSGTSLADCEADDFLETDFSGNVLSGRGAPTREAFLHARIYEARPDVNAIVHCHAPYSIVVVARSHERIPQPTWHSRMKQPNGFPVIDVHHAAVPPQDWPLVGSVIAAGPSAPMAFVLRDHGLVALGRDPIAAEHVAELVEETAMIAFLLGDSE